MRNKCPCGTNLSSPPDGLTMLNSGLFRTSPEQVGPGPCVQTLPSGGGQPAQKVPRILLCPARTATISVLPSFIKNRERVLKVRKEVDTLCQKVRRQNAGIRALPGHFCPHRRTASLPETGLFRDLPEPPRSLALVSFCPHRRTPTCPECTQILLCPTRTANLFVIGGFVKNRERVPKVQIRV